MMGAMTESAAATTPMHDPGGLADVRVAAAAGETRVVVAGQDLSGQVAAVTMVARPWEVPRIILDLRAAVAWDGIALVEYRSPSDGAAVKGMVRDWLNGLSWPDLQSAAAEGSMNAGIGDAFRVALLEQLDRDW